MTKFQKPQADWKLAEVNIAHLKAPVGDPLVAPFIDALDQINAIADRMEGFVWRYTDDTGNAVDTKIADNDRIIFNTSIWDDVPSLERFVWGTVHVNFLRRKSEWFHLMESMHFAMWWVPPETTIPPEEAMRRLDCLNKNGPSSEAFGWAHAPNAKMWEKAQNQGPA